MEQTGSGDYEDAGGWNEPMTPDKQSQRTNRVEKLNPSLPPIRDASYSDDEHPNLANAQNTTPRRDWKELFYSQWFRESTSCKGVGGETQTPPPFSPTQPAYSQPQCTKRTFVVYPATDAAAAAEDCSGQSKRESSPTHDLHSPNKHPKLGFAGCELEDDDYKPNNTHIAVTQQPLGEQSELQSLPLPLLHLIGNPPMIKMSSEYTGLDAAFDLAAANPQPLAQLPMEQIEEGEKPALPINDGPIRPTEENWRNSKRKKYILYKDANEEERIMREFLSNISPFCPFTCKRRAVAQTNRRAHLRKYHYDIYYKYCRGKKSHVEEVRERHLGPAKGDRVCIICDEPILTQEDMQKHLEKKHQSALEVFQRELATARQWDEDISGLQSLVKKEEVDQENKPPA